MIEKKIKKSEDIGHRKFNLKITLEQALFIHSALKEMERDLEAQEIAEIVYTQMLKKTVELLPLKS